MKRKNKPTEKHPHRDAPWTPFYECDTLVNPVTGERREPNPRVRLAKNNHYTVQVSLLAPVEPFGEIVWLSIKRNDRKPIHDWRDLQRIKNEIVGPEFEAVELYPAESRMVDTANQYHLWVFTSYKVPFGYMERLVMGPSSPDDPPSEIAGSVQRPWPAHSRPADLTTSAEALKRFQEDPAFGARVAGFTVEPKKS